MLRAPLAVLLASATAAVAAAPAAAQVHTVRTVGGNAGVVATESPAAARVGRSVLEAGGNAVDAAVATVFAMGVARPQSCGVGGGGFLLYRSPSGRVRALDFRETAPAAITPDVFTGPGLHEDFTGHLTVGVPGTVAGMATALDRYGTMRLRRVIAPAERLARTGFRVPTSLSGAMEENAERLRLFPAAARQYLRGDGTAMPAGTRLRQPDLAATLRRIQRGGPRAFYRGTIARRIVRDMRAARPTGEPGLITLADLAAYRAIWRKAVTGTYRGRQIIGMPPPTSGGVAIIEMLNILEGLDLAEMGQGSADALHAIAEAQKIAFADRGAYLADPDHVRVPARLIAKDYAVERRAEIDPLRAGTYAPGLGPFVPASAARTTDARPAESTTHISVIDRKGAAVAVTCTIEQEFGSAVVAPGTGFLLNNELTDFGAPGTANAPAPGKRPRSSMAPTIVVEGGRPVMVLGAAGGARIIMGVLLPIVNVVDFSSALGPALDAPRLDAGGTSVTIEDGRLEPAVVAELARRGHQLRSEGSYAIRPRVNAAGIVPVQPGLDPRRFRARQAVSDPRTDDGSLAERPRR